MKNWKELLSFVVVTIAVMTIMTVQYRHIRNLAEERDRYKNNTEILFSDVERYKVRDSLNAARVQSLEISAREFERFRADDAALIKELKARNRDLAAVNKTQSQTIIELLAVPRDTMIIRDTIPTPAIAVHCGDAWFDFDGILTKDNFSGTLANRDSLLIAESVQHKRFLGFLWKTQKIKNRRVDVVSKNPHTSILGIEHIYINN